jgi:hypothetical protein
MNEPLRRELTPKTIPDPPPRQHMPASVAGTLVMISVILVAFLLVVWWYTR